MSILDEPKLNLQENGDTRCTQFNHQLLTDSCSTLLSKQEPSEFTPNFYNPPIGTNFPRYDNLSELNTSLKVENLPQLDHSNLSHQLNIRTAYYPQYTSTPNGSGTTYYYDPSSSNGSVANATGTFCNPMDYTKYPMYLNSLMTTSYAPSTDCSQHQFNIPGAPQTANTAIPLKSGLNPTSYHPSTQPNINSMYFMENLPNNSSPRYTDQNFRSNRPDFSINSVSTSEDYRISTNTVGMRSENEVELLVSNLDYNISAKEWRKILHSHLQTTIKTVHSIVLQTQADGSNCALVRVGSIEDARLAISHLHRKKIGYKRIQMNIINHSSSGLSGNKGLKNDVVNLLRSVSGHTLPVCKFIDLFEKRFHRNIGVSDLYKLRDTIDIKEQSGTQGGRMVVLNMRAMQFDGSEMNPLSEQVVCRRHCPEGSREYEQALNTSMLPHVQITLNLLSQRMHSILRDHGGSVPLVSFLACYKHQFGELPIVPMTNNPSSQLDFNDKDNYQHPMHEVQNGPSTSQNEVASMQPVEQLTETEVENTASGSASINESSVGVPLEHLIACIPLVRIVTEMNGVRKIIMDSPETSLNRKQLTEHLTLNNPNASAAINSVSGDRNSSTGTLLDQLHLFSREVVDLLKHQYGCRILLTKFIPTYHHHFGKQCRVADYGYSKLHELIDALPNVVHVMGTGQQRLLTLAHRVQVRRFTNELIKVLKSQSTKSCRLTDYPSLYKKVYRKNFRITDYGVCYLTDMLMEVSDNAVEISQIDSDCLIVLPKRVQTMEERERTDLFAIEVADLLCQSPRCRLLFNKFIPSYHHHFSRQCRVADYGFTKLVDLLEAVPNVVRIVENQGEKYVTLVHSRHLRIIAEQLLAILESSPGKRLPISELPKTYLKHQGYALCLEDFGLGTVKELLEKLPRLVRIETTDAEEVVQRSSLLSQSEENMIPCESPTNEDEALSVEATKEILGTNGDVENGGVDKPIELADRKRENIMEYVCLADRTQIKQLAHKVLLIMLEAPVGSLSIQIFRERYRCTFRDEANLQLINDELSDIVLLHNSDTNIMEHTNSEISAIGSIVKNSTNHLHASGESEQCTPPEDTNSSIIEANKRIEQLTVITLRPLIMFARELRELLRQNQGKLLLVQLCSAYQRRFGIPLKPQRYHYPSLATLLQAVDFVAVMRGRGVRCTLVLCQDFLGKLSYRVAYNTTPMLSEGEAGEINLLVDDNSTTQNKDHGLVEKSQPTVENSQTHWSSNFANQLGQFPNGTVVHSQPTTSLTGLQLDKETNVFMQNINRTYADQSDPCLWNKDGTATTTLSAPTGYYPIFNQNPTQLSQQLLPDRSSYSSNPYADPHTSCSYIPSTNNYGGFNSSTSHQQHIQDCQPSCSGPYNPFAFPTAPVPFVTQPPNCFVTPNGEPPMNGSFPYTGGAVYSTSSIYPYQMGTNYAPMMNQFTPQIQCTPQLVDLRSIRTDTQTTSQNPTYPLGYPAPDQFGPIEQTSRISQLTRSNLSTTNEGQQQQLDEIVERLAYDGSYLNGETSNLKEVIPTMDAHNLDQVNLYRSSDLPYVGQYSTSFGAPYHATTMLPTYLPASHTLSTPNNPANILSGMPNNHSVLQNMCAQLESDHGGIATIGTTSTLQNGCMPNHEERNADQANAIQSSTNVSRMKMLAKANSFNSDPKPAFKGTSMEHRDVEQSDYLSNQATTRVPFTDGETVPNSSSVNDANSTTRVDGCTFGTCTSQAPFSACYYPRFSSDESMGQFSLDGLLAELRREEKQKQQLLQQQQAQQQQQSQTNIYTNPETDLRLKQNTHILLNNFAYL